MKKHFTLLVSNLQYFLKKYFFLKKEDVRFENSDEIVLCF